MSKLVSFDPNQSVTMSSLEIAELTGKDHKNVLRDIRETLQAASIDALRFEHCYSDGINKGKVKQYNLPRRECDLVVSGYSVKYRLAIIDRWHELEAKQIAPAQLALPDFNNPVEAARAWADAKESEQVALVIIKDQQESIARKDEYIIASNEASIKAGEILVREFVKSNDMIDLGEKEFYEWMRGQGIVLKNSCEPDGALVKRGYFTYKPTDEEHGGRVRYTMRITPRGQVWLAARYIKYLDKMDELDAA